MDKKRRFLRALAFILYCTSLLLLIRFVFFKHAFYVIRNHFTLYYSADSILDGIRNANLVPFKNIIAIFSNSSDYEFPINNNLGNIAGFIPQGFLLAFLFPRCRKIAQNIKVVFLTSVIFEVLQLLTGLGIFDIDDLMLNVTGGIIGWSLFRFLSGYFQKMNLLEEEKIDQTTNR